MKKSGIIAFDIDGTLTAMRSPLAPDVKVFLEKLHAEGWQLLFVTGRVFSWSYHLLEELKIPYTLAVQNGSLILDMPSQKIIYKSYVPTHLLPKIEDLILSLKAAPVIYTGYDYGELCYYTPHYFTEEKLQYLGRRSQALKETWIPLKNVTDYPLEDFASIRCFVEKNIGMPLSQKIEAELKLEAPCMMDSFDEQYQIVQITASDVNKGSALHQLIAKNNFKEKGSIIACGDDYNDISMLKEADIAVVIETAPQEVLQLADVIAPSAQALGIIKGVSEALLKLKELHT
jgi:Cof subfamily protein (haloacid dehalogenase superfamily)